MHWWLEEFVVVEGFILNFNKLYLKQFKFTMDNRGYALFQSLDAKLTKKHMENSFNNVRPLVAQSKDICFALLTNG